jgi:pimeloyl-ACP methyl ester carboxylesterase
MRPVATCLRAAGHEVYTPTLTGLGERAHLNNPQIGLETRVEDLLGVLEYEDLRNVVLVGKSYGGMVITAVAERAPERLGHLVYLDAVVPGHGQSMLDILGPEVSCHMQAVVRERGDGWRLAADRSSEPRLTDHPFRILTQPVTLGSPAAAALPRTYILSTKKPEGVTHTRVTAAAAARAVAEGWRYRELPADHDAECSMPDAVAALLLELA